MIFLRPLFLLLLIIPFVFLYVRKKSGSKSAWADVCDPKLLPYLIVDVNGEKRTKLYSTLMFVLWCVASIALAGPAILKTDVPTNTLHSGLIAVVDMSPVTDERALEQATHKLLDLTENVQDTSIGLVLTDQKAYVALPLTQDKNILRNIIAQFKEKDIMPSIGQNIPAGIEYAGKLLSQSNFDKGQILVLTAGVNNVDEIQDAVKKSKYDVFFVGVGNREEKTPVLLNNGSFWNNGALYGLSEIKKTMGFSFVSASLDDSDVKFILNSQQLEQDKITDITTKQYQDLGVWLVVLMLPFGVLLFRKGVLFAFLMLLFVNNAEAGFWQRTEQEDYQTQMNAINNFNTKKYEEALSGFFALSDTDIEALYNMGNTLAFMGKIEEAIQTYEAVLKQNPDHEDAAFNLEYLKKQQQAQQKQQEQQPSAGESQSEKNQSQEKSSENSDKKGEQKESENQSEKNDENKNEPEKKDEANQNDTESETEKNKENKEDSKKEEQPVIAPQNEDKQNSSKDQKEQPVTIANQKQKEWLDRINSDAGQVLRYRLRQQYGAQQ